jgi:hypothetical protein
MRHAHIILQTGAIWWLVFLPCYLIADLVMRSRMLTPEQAEICALGITFVFSLGAFRASRWYLRREMVKLYIQNMGEK